MEACFDMRCALCRTGGGKDAAIFFFQDGKAPLQGRLNIGVLEALLDGGEFCIGSLQAFGGGKLQSMLAGAQVLVSQIQTAFRVVPDQPIREKLDCFPVCGDVFP